MSASPDGICEVKKKVLLNRHVHVEQRRGLSALTRNELSRVGSARSTCPVIVAAKNKFECSKSAGKRTSHSDPYPMKKIKDAVLSQLVSSTPSTIVPKHLTTGL